MIASKFVLPVGSRARGSTSTVSNGKGSTSQARARGFTLVELSVVVVIIGILASLAIYSVRGYILSAKTAEAREIIASIKAGEEAYFGETFNYLGVTGGAALGDNYHPISTLDGSIKADWNNTGCPGCLARFRTIGVQPNAPVAFRYSVVAAADGCKNVTLDESLDQAICRGTRGAIYAVQATSDLKAGGAKSIYASSNFSAEIYSENEGQ